MPHPARPGTAVAAVRVPRHEGLLMVQRLGAAAGPVLVDPDQRAVSFLVRPGTQALWGPQTPFRLVTLTSTPPPARRQPPGPYWLIPPGHRPATDVAALRAAFRTRHQPRVTARRTTTSPARHRPTMVLYVTADPAQDPAPLLHACRTYARERWWTVSPAAELVDTTPTSAARRPTWAAARRMVTEGHADGILTYARPMLATGADHWADLEVWAAARKALLAAAWEPAPGALVLDTLTGRTGVVQTAADPATVWLRPAGGGREWTTAAHALTPVSLPTAGQR